MRQLSQLAVFNLPTTSTVRGVLGWRSSYCSRPLWARSDELMLNRCRSVAIHRNWRRSTVGVDHPWWRRTHDSSSNFVLTGSILLLVHSHFSRTMTKTSLYSSSTKPPLLWFIISTFIGILLQNPPPSAMLNADWFNCRDVTRHG